MSDANVSVLLAEEKAFWMDSSHLGLLPDESIVREWRNLNIQTRTECIAFLKSRTTVTNPKAQTKAYSGVWRVLKIEDIVERNKQGGTDSLTIRETLADGYDTTLVGKFPRLAEEADVVGSGTTEAANIAHPGGTAAVQEDWRTITIRWKDLNHDSLEAIRAERSAVTATTLTVGTEAKTGPWSLISRKPSWEEDGTGVYEETWSLDEWHMESKGKTANTKVIVNRYVQNVPKDRIKTVLDAEIEACTGYGTQGYTYEQKLYWRDLYADIITEVSQAVKIEIAAFTAELDDYKTVSEKSGENLYDADISAYETTTAAQGHTIRTQKSRNSDGTINASKTDALAVKQEITIEDSLVSAGKTEQTKKGNNLFDADLASYAIAQTAGKIIRREKVINNDGTYDVVITETVNANQTASTDGTHSDQHLDADNRTEDTEVHTAESAPLADVAFATQGTVVETENAPNEDGTFRTTAKTVVSKEQEILDVVVGEDKFKQSKADYGKQIKDTNLAEHFPVAATTGEIQTRRISENADGTFDVTRDRDIAKEISSSESQKRVDTFETELIVKGRNITVEPTLPSDTQSEGVVSTLKKINNDYNLWDSEATTETAHAKLSNGSYLTRYGTAYWWSARNYTKTAWDNLVGSITIDSTTDNHVQFEYNKFKLVDGTIIKRPVRETGSIPGWTIGLIATSQMDSERISAQSRSGKWKYKVITYTTVIYQDSSITTAYGRITGSGILASTLAGGSRVVNLSNGQYLTFVVTSNEASATWSDDSGLN